MSAKDTDGAHTLQAPSGGQCVSARARGKMSSFDCFTSFVFFYLQILLETMANTLHAFYLWRRRRATLPATLSGKTLVITGANTGIGFVTVQTMAQLGARVIMGCRDMEKARKALEEIVETLGEKEKDNVAVMELDLNSFDSVRTFAARVNKSVDKIDWLINNAGVMMTPKMATKDGFEYQFGVNHLGHFLLTNLLLAKVCAAGPGSRVLSLSSVAHMPGRIHFDDINLQGKGAYTPAKAYYQSKLANLLFAVELARRLKGSGVSVFAIHPGLVKTELGRHLNKFSQIVLHILHHFILISPEFGAQTTLHCALADNIEHLTGHYFQ